MFAACKGESLVNVAEYTNILDRFPNCCLTEETFVPFNISVHYSAALAMIIEFLAGGKGTLLQAAAASVT